MKICKEVLWDIENSFRPHDWYIGVLQVLDSVSVDSTELADARNKYTGRLQKEIVEELVDHKNLEALQVIQFRENVTKHVETVRVEAQEWVDHSSSR